MQKLTDGLWRWTARHPEWHPGEFGAEVASFAAKADGAGKGTLLLIDPLLPEDEAEASEVLETLDGAVDERVAILISVPYHVRSSEDLRRRYRKDTGTTIHGHAAAGERLKDRAGFNEMEPGAPVPGGVTAHSIGKPTRHGMPFHVPRHEALVFGDAVAEHDG